MNESILSKAVTALKKGEVIVYPTDTLYGLGADIFNEYALKKIFKIKKRPFSEPLSVAVSNIKEIEEIAFLNQKAKIIAKKFLPGKLTLILEKKEKVSDTLTGGQKKVAIRIPNNKIALTLLSEFGPLTATSANIHGMKTLSSISQIKQQLKGVDIKVYIGSGHLIGQPSTIIDITKGKLKILREGAIKTKDILDVLKNE
jgi:L-threonylcarbamoyladenylate synthase